MKLQHRQFASPAELSREMTDCLADFFQMSGIGPFAVMLSGGKTPLVVYDALARRRIAASRDLTICYSDERDVPADSPESNYANTKPLLKALGIPAERVLRVQAELGWRESAAQYDRDLGRFLAAGGRIKIGLLGLGPDGHTASLFTPEDVGRGNGHYAVAVPKAQKPDRVSVTPELLCRVDRVVILASGPDKRDIVEKLLRTPHEVVAGLALRDLPAVELWQA